MKGVEIDNLEIELKGDYSVVTPYLGGLFITVDDRKYTLDVYKTFINDPEFTGEDLTRFECHLQEDSEVFPDSPQNVTKEDLLNSEHNGLEVEFFIDNIEEEDILKMMLHVTIDGEAYQLTVKQEK